MATQYTSKHGTVSKPPYELYLSFTDMRNFLNMLPEDKKQGVTADFDTLDATVQGFHVGVRVKSRVPYSLIEVEDNGAPFRFMVALHFDAAAQPGMTDFHINLSADLNLMLKMVQPLLWLLERYQKPYYVVYTNFPGEIVYEDDYQIVVKVDENVVVEDVQPSWSPKD